jgi:hypothetical protein
MRRVILILQTKTRPKSLTSSAGTIILYPASVLLVSLLTPRTIVRLATVTAVTFSASVFRGMALVSRRPQKHPTIAAIH